MVKKANFPQTPEMPEFKITIRRIDNKTVDGKASMRYGQEPIRVKRITSDQFNPWEMFSILTSWLHAKDYDRKQELRMKELSKGKEK